MDFKSPRVQFLSFGSCDVITPQAELEGSLSSLGRVEIVDDEILDGNVERFITLLSYLGNFGQLLFVILDNDSKLRPLQIA